MPVVGVFLYAAQQLDAPGRETCVSLGHFPCGPATCDSETRASTPEIASTTTMAMNCTCESGLSVFDFADTRNSCLVLDLDPVASSRHECIEAAGGSLRGTTGCLRVGPGVSPIVEVATAQHREKRRRHPETKAGPVIEVRDLSKHFGSTVAVDHLSFSVRPGMVTGFLGPNGSGKSTTMRMILGLDRPSKGATTVNGRPYGAIRRPLHEVGALLDAKAMHGGRSAYNHLLCVAQSNGISRRRVGECLDLVGLDTVGRKRARTYSLGMGQRLGIATALLGDPQVLMFDEPINGLDPEGILWIRTLLRSLAAQGRTVFVSSHLMSEMALTADHLVVIGRGRLIADSSTTDLIARSSQGYVHVRTPDVEGLARRLRIAGAVVDTAADTLRVTGLDCAAIGELAALDHIVLHELTPRSASLEEAFMELTRDSVDYRTDATVGIAS
jgi:ABC-2 type transport system ATP-binding protein